jgi:hypothetical protein
VGVVEEIVRGAEGTIDALVQRLVSNGYEWGISDGN